jgi:hypothetical protein
MAGPFAVPRAIYRRPLIAPARVLAREAQDKLANLAPIRGRPGPRRAYVQRFATSWRCQRRSVSGLTNSERQRLGGSRRLAAARKARSAVRSSGLRVWRRRISSSWRSTTIELLELLRTAAEQDQRDHASESEIDECEQAQPPRTGSGARLYGAISSAGYINSPRVPAGALQGPIGFAHPTPYGDDARSDPHDACAGSRAMAFGGRVRVWRALERPMGACHNRAPRALVESARKRSRLWGKRRLTGSS